MMLNIENAVGYSQLSIGELYDKLERLPKETIVMLGDDRYFDSKSENAFDSYRGYYEECMLEPTRDKEALQHSTVGNLLHTLDKALECGVMEGYKGGDFKVSDNTLVNIAYYGCSGSKAINVVTIDDVAYIVTKD